MLCRLFPLLLITPVFAIPASTTLTLVNETGFNQLSVNVNPQLDIGLPISLASSSSATLTGSVIADFQIDPNAGTSSELTLRQGRVNGTRLTFSREVFLVGNVYNIVIDQISAAIDTPSPPGIIDPTTGNFDASQYAFTLDQGTVTGAVRIPGQPALSVDEAFTPDSPVTGNGSGTGTLTLLPTTSPQPELFRAFIATIILPVNLNDTFETGGNSISVTASGTIKASGTVQVPSSEYLAWALAEGITDTDGQADANGDGVPNAITWALGLGAFDDARNFVLKTANGAYEIQLPPTGTIAPITIQGSDLSSPWTPVSATRISSSLNPIPPASTGLITISRMADEFLRLKVDE